MGEGAQAAAAAMRRMGQVLRYRGDLDGAASWLDRALAMERRMSADSPGLAETLHELGVLRARRGAVESARTLLEESLRIKVVLKLREEECEERLMRRYLAAWFAVPKRGTKQCWECWRCGKKLRKYLGKESTRRCPGCQTELPVA